MMYSRFGKRFFDTVAASLVFIFLFPLFLSVILIILFLDGKPVFFLQERIGKSNVVFRIIKFRTMTAGKSIDAKITAANDPRITKIGRILRKFKLDELPQLINVVKGEMSIVGPRPEVPEYARFIPDDVANKIYSIRPGITDLASISYIDENLLLESAEDKHLFYVEKIQPDKNRMNVVYVEKMGFFYDLFLIFSTIRKIVAR